VRVLYIESLDHFNAEFPDFMEKEGIDCVHILFSATELDKLDTKHYATLGQGLSIIMDVYEDGTLLPDMPFHYNVFESKARAYSAVLELKRHLDKFNPANVLCISTGRNSVTEMQFNEEQDA